MDLFVDHNGGLVNNGATISPCGRYRYLLWRRVEALQLGELSRSLAFVMLNPSTADGTTDDPTIRRCLGFARTMGATRLVVANIFAYRATDPRELLTAHDPEGPENLWYLETVMRFVGPERTILAWGANEMARRRVAQLGQMFRGCQCLKVTKDGSPGHPLYLSSKLTPIPWPGGQS